MRKHYASTFFCSSSRLRFVATLAFSTALVSATLAHAGEPAATADLTSEVSPESPPPPDPLVNGEAGVTFEPAGKEAAVRKDAPWLGVSASEA